MPIIAVHMSTGPKVNGLQNLTGVLEFFIPVCGE